MLDMPLSVKIDEYRRKQREGTITDDDFKEAIRLMRAGREQARVTSTKKRAAEVAQVDSNALIDELGGL